MLSAALERAWTGGWLSRPALDPEALIAAAIRRTGLAFAPQDGSGWRTRLDILAQALEQEAALSPLGLTIAHGQLVAALANRLRAEALWRRHPEILAIPIKAPVLVVGQMRSGSTRVQRMLACNPELTATRFYESWNPLPRVPWLGAFADRYARAATALCAARLLNPGFAAIHPTGALAVDEEIGLQNLSIFGAAFEAQWRVPSFVEHIEAADARPAYAEFRRLLQTLAWLRPAHRGRRWVLKVPQFAQDLPALIETFPDALVVRLHRDPVAVVGSSASLARCMMEVQSDAVDVPAIGREWLRKTALRQRRMDRALAHSGVRRVTIDYAAMEEDWREQARRLHRAMGLAFTPAVERRIERYLAGATGAAGAAGGHRYSLAAFELDSRMVRAGVDGPPAPLPCSAG